MAAPVVPDPTFYALYDDATKWTHPTLDYEYYAERVGAPTPTVGTVMDRPNTITTLVNLATHTPTLIAFIPENDNNVIYIGHSLTIYPSDPANTLPIDDRVIADRVVALVGNDPTSVQPLVLSNAFFTHGGPIRYKHTDYIIGVEQLTKAPPELRSGPHANTEVELSPSYAAAGGRSK